LSRLYLGRFSDVHIGGPSSNQATSLESQMIHPTQLLPGRTLRFYAKPFIEASELIGQLVLAVIVAAQGQDGALPAEGKEVLICKLNLLIEQLDILGLDLTKLSAQRLRDYVSNEEHITVKQISLHVLQLRDRLPDQLESSYLLSLTARERELFDSAAPHYGEQVSIAFSSIVYEIDEAAKCLALGRSTACAFHSIRCLEAGIRALSRCLQIPDPTRASDRSWQKLLSNLKCGIDGKWPTNSDRLSGDGEFFDNAYAALAAIQNPWRNATMHLDQKYTEDEARHIFDMVRSFMKKLAYRCDEDGKPYA
jgi:hypothetical protein